MLEIPARQLILKASFACVWILSTFWAIEAQCQSQVAAPLTPPGLALRTWLEAFNAADPSKIDEYINAYHPQTSAEAVLSLRQETGAFDLVSIERSEPLRVTFRVKQQVGGGLGYGDLRVGFGSMPHIESFSLMPIPANATIDDPSLTDDERLTAVRHINQSLKEFYVYPAVASQMAKDLNQRLQSGRYAALDDGTAFAAQLTTDLRQISKDKHLSVIYVPYRQVPETQALPRPKRTAAEESLARQDLLRDNCGLRELKILPGNVGYVRFDVFSDPIVCAETASAAMAFVANADALIFDIRENHGGDPRMVAFLASYLFAKPTHINDLFNRHDDAITPFWTLPYVPGKIMPDTQVLILTSHDTFSAAEEFSYDLQSLHRATIVGEVTAGGAHPVDTHRVDEHFSVRIPVARAINPVTKTDWEGTGVTPDVAVAAADALARAELLARTSK